MMWYGHRVDRTVEGFVEDVAFRREQVLNRGKGIDARREEIEKIALAESNIQQYIAGKEIRKIIVVPKRLVNVVV